MKLRKSFLTLLMTIATIIVAGIFNASYAAIGSMHLDIKMLRRSGYGYQALEKNIWKIVETNAEATTWNYDKTIYCLKGGPGFGSNVFGSGTTTAREYTRYYDMKDPGSIPEPYSNALPDVTSPKYKSLLWLLDSVYVAPKVNASTDEIQMAEQYRNLLLTNAGIPDSYLTDDDIDAVQQLAVWHFTNDDAYKIPDGGTFEFWINANQGSDANYNPMSDEVNENGWERADECKKLYNYLVNTATEMGTKYQIKTASRPYSLEQTTKTQKTKGNNYIIGPFKINKISDTEATLTGTFKNGENVINPTLIDADGNEFATLNDTIGKEFYISIPDTTTIEKITFEINVTYYSTTITYWSVKDAPEDDQPVAVVERQKVDYSDNTEYTPVVKEEKFDLALRKFIVSIGGVAPEVNREPQISEEALQGLNQGSTTAEKVHPKNPLMVKTGDKVVYTIRVYNEGEVNGYVKEITDYLPEGLKLAENSDINTQNGWKSKLDNEKAIVTDKLAGTLLEAFDGTTLKYLDVQIECEVTATVQSKDTILKNIAEITAHSDESGNTQVIDRDSTPNNVDSSKYGTTSQEDDDDFEQLIIIGKYFDLSLRKFIEGVDDTALSNGDGRKIREPVVDVLPLLNGEKTATYNHPKEPVQVDVGDEVTYVIRVYNEGQIDGYVNEITDYLPQYLEFINNEFNASYGWRVSDDGRTVKTTITSPDTEYSASRDELYENRTDGNDKVLLKAFDTTAKKLDYIDVKIRCKVKNTGVAEKITNIAEITKATDNTGNEVTDRDSKPGDLTLPADSVLPSYKDEEIAREDEYIPGQEDDDDFEKVIVQKFDLSLRKFITGVNDKEVTSRIPVFSKNEEGKYTYTHPKTPVEVASGDIVIYTLRVYNEGNQAGYAKEVKDDIPEGLEFLPDNAINKEYRWKLYKEDGTETTSVEEAKTIRTDYLSKEQETATGRDNLLDAFNTIKMTQPDFRDLKIAFKVTEPNTSDRIIINTAEISEDSDEKGEKVDDIDSIPDNNKEGEDDIDIEKVKVKYFDLALEKIITEYSIKLDGKTTVTKTNHKFGVKPEPVVKIELKNYTIKNAVIKYKYQIKITNEGEMAGYAEEVKDYIPEGLKFVQAENPKWKLGKDGKTVTTDQLKDTLLQPGESAVVEITLQWINGQHNLGLKQNWAEISEDKDEHKNPVDDIDSTPNNRKEGEDDIDDASVVLSITTGIGENYVVITGGVLAIICAGIVLIRKLVI